MTRRYKILAGLIILFLGMLVYLEAVKPDPINWYPSYGKNDKIPFGSHVFYNTLKDSRDGNFKEVNIPPYEFIKDSASVNGTYLFVNDLVLFDEAETHRLLDWVSQGNTLYVASRSISKVLLDTLSLEIEAYYDLDNFERKPLIELANPQFKKEVPYTLDIEVNTNYFNIIDTLNTVVLGTFDLKRKDTLSIIEPKVNFIKQGYGDGAIYLHLFPEAFTNYFMLYEDNFVFTNSAQQYIPATDVVYWDNHYKNSKTFYTSPLYMLFKNRYLKWAWYVLLIGVFLWVFFEGKRKQRAIPIIAPLQNQTLAFSHTIAGMYLEKGDHKSIAHHMSNHFMEYLRSTHNLDTSSVGLNFITTASAKTGNAPEDTKRLIDFMKMLDEKPQITKEELQRLNTLIQGYKTE